MKKLFTLVVAAFAAVSVFAQTRDIGEPTNNVKDGDKVWYDATTKVVTFYENGSYRPGWWLASWDKENRKNVPTDFSDYDELVVELENPNGVNVNVRLEYEGADASYANSKGNKIVVPLDKDAAKKVNQAYLQCWDEITNPVTVTFKKAYFSSKSTGSEVVLSDKETALDSWGANINMVLPLFSLVSC